MIITTVGLPKSYIEAMKKLIEENGLYTSRSELIRCAIREFLLKELQMIKDMAKIKDNPENIDDSENIDNDKFARVPFEKIDKNGKLVKQFKTYKILERLE